MAFDEIAGISAAEESVRLDIAEAQAEADKEAQEIYQKAENKKAVLRAKAESRCAAAAKLIAERIVNG